MRTEEEIRELIELLEIEKQKHIRIDDLASARAFAVSISNLYWVIEDKICEKEAMHKIRSLSLIQGY